MNGVLKDGDKIIKTGEVISKNVYKVSQEQSEALIQQAEERVENARKAAMLNIRERYNQRMEENRKALMDIPFSLRSENT